VGITRMTRNVISPMAPRFDPIPLLIEAGRSMQGLHTPSSTRLPFSPAPLVKLSLVLHQARRQSNPRSRPHPLPLSRFAPAMAATVDRLGPGRAASSSDHKPRAGPQGAAGRANSSTMATSRPSPQRAAFLCGVDPGPAERRLRISINVSSH